MWTTVSFFLSFFLSFLLSFFLSLSLKPGSWVKATTNITLLNVMHLLEQTCSASTNSNGICTPIHSGGLPQFSWLSFIKGAVCTGCTNWAISPYCDPNIVTPGTHPTFYYCTLEPTGNVSLRWFYYEEEFWLLKTHIVKWSHKMAALFSCACLTSMEGWTCKWRMHWFSSSSR